MADRSYHHPYRRSTRIQYSIEILYIPIDYPLKDIEMEVKHRWGNYLDGCRTIRSDFHKDTYIFYINFSFEKAACDCSKFLKENDYLCQGMLLKEKLREVPREQDASPVGRERDRRGRGVARRGRGRGFVKGNNPMNDQEYVPLDPGHTLNIPDPPKLTNIQIEMPKLAQDFIVHVQDIPSFVDKDIFSDMILANNQDVKEFSLRDDSANISFKEAIVYMEDEASMKLIISKINHVKVGGKPLRVSEKNKQNHKNEVNPSDYISPLEPMGVNAPLKKFEAQTVGLPPVKGRNSVSSPEQPKSSMQKTITMSNLLYQFIKTKKKAIYDGFIMDGGDIRHENGSLILTSENKNSITTLYNTLSNEVSEWIQTFSSEDYKFLTTAQLGQTCIIEMKCSEFMRAGQLNFYLTDGESTVQIFGIKGCVEIVQTKIEEALYYQFFMDSPMDIYVSVFPGTLHEIIGNFGFIKDNKITIKPEIGLKECKRMREKFLEVQNAIICETCASFPFEMITSGLKFCKQNNLRVAIIFKDKNGVLFKKYKPGTEVTLCGNRAQLFAANNVFSKPISHKMLATQKGLNAITQKSSPRNPSITKNLEQEYSVYIQLLPDSIDVMGFIKDDVDNAVARIQKIFENLDIFLSHIIQKFQVNFLLEAASLDVQWTMDIISELELDYDIELAKTGGDYKLKGTQEALQKIEREKVKIIANFKDIIRHTNTPIQVDKMSIQCVNNLLDKFFNYYLFNENIFICYGWNVKDSHPRTHHVDLIIDIIGKSNDVNLISSKIKDIKPKTGKLREKFGAIELQHLHNLQPVFLNIEASEFVLFKPVTNQIEYHSLGISSKTPWDIFDSIMSDQEVVRALQIAPSTLYFLRSKKLLKDCENLCKCSIVEEVRERERESYVKARRQSDRDSLTIKGKHNDVKAALDKLKVWIDNFNTKSITVSITSKLRIFFGFELESLKKDVEQNQMLIVDIREAKKKLSVKIDDKDAEIEFTIRVEALNKATCDQFAQSIEEKLKIVRSDEFKLSDRQLRLLMDACKEQKIPRNEHFYVDIEFKPSRTGSARILVLQHFKDALKKGIEITAPYFQFEDYIYSPPDFLQELLFSYKKYSETININSQTLGVECLRPTNPKGNYKLSGNRSSIQKMLFNLKNFELSFVQQCEKFEFGFSLPLNELKKDSRYTGIERDILRNYIVKIFMDGEFPNDLENEVNSLPNDICFDGPSFDIPHSSNRILGTYTHVNTTIEVMKGDITTLEVSCVVNAANDQLKHEGGVAKAISDAGGPSIQKGCNKYIQEKGPLAVGGAVLQGSGNLPCMKIIHVSSALWDPFNQTTCINQLKSCISTVFQLCEKNKLGSIAIPGISTGNYGFPAAVSTLAVVQECKDYFNTNLGSSIRKLIFIDIDDNVAKCYNADCQKIFGGKTRPQQFLDELQIPPYRRTSVGRPPRDTFEFEEDIEVFADTNPTFAPANSQVEFYWKENDGQFYPYDGLHQTLLKTEYTKNPVGKANFKRGEYSYTIDFSTLTQTNDSTKISRVIKIKTLVDPDSTPLPKPYPVPEMDGEESELHCHWYFFNEHNQWIPYGYDINKKLSDAYFKNPKGSLILSQMNNYSYKIDFQSMTQTNQETTTVRTIRVDKKKLESAMGNLKITSTENVILFGITENIPLAKTKLSRFIKTKCATKHLNIHGIPKMVMIPTIIKLKKEYTHVKVEVKDKGEDYVINMEGFEKHVSIVDNKLRDVYIKCLEELQQDLAVQLVIPDEWEVHNANEMSRIVSLVKGCPEWLKVANEFNRTSRRAIHSIDRVQNKWLWRKYQQTKESFNEINQNPNEMTVFHGTRTTDPELIYKGSEGFDFRHSSQGMWGRANYFAVNASFCESYQYSDPQTRLHQILMVKLLAGNVVHLQSSSTLTMPPLLPAGGNSHFVGQRYDTVSGDHSAGSKVYMVYTNERAYPEYLITYS